MRCDFDHASFFCCHVSRKTAGGRFGWYEYILIIDLYCSYMKYFYIIKKKVIVYIY